MSSLNEFIFRFVMTNNRSHTSLTCRSHLPGLIQPFYRHNLILTCEHKVHWVVQLKVSSWRIYIFIDIHKWISICVLPTMVGTYIIGFWSLLNLHVVVILPMYLTRHKYVTLLRYLIWHRCMLSSSRLLKKRKTGHLTKNNNNNGNIEILRRK